MAAITYPRLSYSTRQGRISYCSNKLGRVWGHGNIKVVQLECGSDN